MRLDKKAVSAGLRLILWRGIGAAEVRGDVPEAELLALLAEATAPA
jgi:3-dehydroquinate synthase